MAINWTPEDIARVRAFLENELNNRMNGGFEDGDHKEYVAEARKALASFNRMHKKVSSGR